MYKFQHFSTVLGAHWQFLYYFFLYAVFRFWFYWYCRRLEYTIPKYASGIRVILRNCRHMKSSENRLKLVCELNLCQWRKPPAYASPHWMPRRKSSLKFPETLNQWRINRTGKTWVCIMHFIIIYYDFPDYLPMSGLLQNLYLFTYLFILKLVYCVIFLEQMSIHPR